MILEQQKSASPLFARLLRQARREHSWSQARLAEHLSTDPMTISRWERGLTLPTPYLREKLCQLFAKTPQEFGLLDAEEPPLSASLPSFLIDPLLPTRGLLVGREQLVGEIKQRLLSSLVVTLCALGGLPGIGKTALAVHLAHEQDIQQQFEGILWAGLGPSPEVSRHLSRWGHLLGLSVADSGRLTSIEAWMETLRSLLATRRVLIIIDDVWRLVDALALQVGGERCAYLITTRFPEIALHFGEGFQVGVRELTIEESLALLNLLAPGVVEQEPYRVRALVQAVGGLPLALSLMGNYLRKQAYSGQRRRIHAALARLSRAEERLQLAEPRSALERHPSLSRETPLSLHSVIEVSVKPLSESARRAFYALSVFPPKPNSFSEEAACAVAACTEDTLDLLTDAGLLESSGSGRYCLHQTVADYARLHLEGTAVNARFITYAITFLEHPQTDYGRLEQESSVLLAALHVAAASKHHAALVRGVTAFVPYLLVRGLYPVAEQYIDQGIEAAQAEEDRHGVAQMSLYQGELAQKQGRFAFALNCYEQSLTLARLLDDQKLICRLLADLGWVHDKVGNYQEAEAYTREGLVLAQALGEPKVTCRLLATLGAILEDIGDIAGAQAIYQEGLPLARALADPEVLCHLLINASSVALDQGDLEQAESYCQEGLTLARQIGHREWMILLLINLATAAQYQRHYEQAERASQEGLVLARQIGHREWTAYLLSNLAELALEQNPDASQVTTYLEEALSLARQLNQTRLLGQVLFVQGELFLKQQRIEQAAAIYREILAQGKTMPQIWQAVAQFGLARVAAAQGHTHQARQLGVQARASLETAWASYMGKVDAWLHSLPEP
jgi:tetratricopeptide (TPR) repeat protein/transcriptional regulator with XRE-family HTH domain